MNALLLPHNRITASPAFTFPYFSKYPKIFRQQDPAPVLSESTKYILPPVDAGPIIDHGWVKVMFFRLTLVIFFLAIFRTWDVGHGSEPGGDSLILPHPNTVLKVKIYFSITTITITVTICKT